MAMGRLEALMARVFPPFRREAEEPPGLDGKSYEELFEVYDERGWPPPDEGRELVGL